MRKLFGDLDIRKADKRGIIDLRQVLQGALDNKADLGNIQGLINKFSSEHTSKAFELRQELFKKFTEV